jgi:hypothetical protein
MSYQFVLFLTHTLQTMFRFISQELALERCANVHARDRQILNREQASRLDIQVV